MTMHNPNLNPAQNIYNAPTQPQYAFQSCNRTIPLNQGQGLVHASANLGGAGVQSGAARNVNISGGAVSNSGGRNTGHGGSARVSGQSDERSSNRGRSMNNGGGNTNANGGANRSGASQNTNTAMVMHGHAQVQHPQIPPVHYGTLHPQHQHFPYNHMHIHQAQVHPQGRDPYPYPYPNIPFHLRQPHTGGLLGTLVPYVPLSHTGPKSIPRSIQDVISLDYAPRIQTPAYPVPSGYPILGNVIINGWDSRWDGSGGFRGCGTGSRGGRGREIRDSRRR